MPPIIFLVVSIVLWQWANAVFMPELLADRFLEIIPVSIVDAGLRILGPLAKQLVFFNFVLLYFGAYFLFAFYWDRLRRTFRNPFYAAFVLWCVNLFVIFPLAGRGVFGYKLPQGALSVNVFTLATHWVFARMMQRQKPRAQSEASR